MNRVIRKKEAEVQRDEHELLQQEDFGWLGEIRRALSPYWAVRMEYSMTQGRSVS